MSAASVSGELRSWSFLAVICLAWAIHGRAHSQDEGATTFDLRITAQPLDEALKEFSRQSGMQVIFFSSLTDGLHSPGVRGEYTVAGALEALLAGSGLTFRVINPRTVEILDADAPELFYGEAEVIGGLP